MKRILVLSDSHGYPLNGLLMKAESLGRIDAVFHLGDGYRDVDGFRADFPLVFRVAGNCDFLGRDVRELVVNCGMVRLLAVHGDMYDVKWDLTRLSYYAEEKCVQVALFGHTHQPFAGYAGGVMMINPGALKDGRYAVVQIENGQAVPLLKTF